MVALASAIVDGLIIGGLIGGTVLVVGGTMAVIESLVDTHIQEMERILRRRDETIQKLQQQNLETIRALNKMEKDLHRHAELQEIFELFQLQVDQAKKLITEAEFTDANGKKIKGFDGKYLKMISLF